MSLIGGVTNEHDNSNNAMVDMYVRTPLKDLMCMILATNLKRISLLPTANISLLATSYRICNKEFVLRYYTMMCEAMGMNPEGFIFFLVNRRIVYTLVPDGNEK